MKTVKHLGAIPSVTDLMEVAYNEGLEGNMMMMSVALENKIEDTCPGDTKAWGRISDAHINGWADYRDQLGD